MVLQGMTLLLRLAGEVVINSVIPQRRDWFYVRRAALENAFPTGLRKASLIILLKT